MKKYQVFVSSTYRDLVAERQVVLMTLLRHGFIPQGMELFPPTNETAWELIKNLIDECDYYMVIVAQRYGTLFPQTFSPDPVRLSARASYTYMEYEYAQLTNKPTIALLFDGAEHAGAEKDQVPREGLNEFSRRIYETGRSIGQWRDEASLIVSVTTGLQNLVENSPGQGWVRGPCVIQPKKKPFPITLLGPLTGEDSPFGWSQARSVVAALMRILYECCGKRWESHEEYFSLRLVDTNDPGASLIEEFSHAQKTSRVIFGPMDSDEVKTLFYERASGDHLRLSEARVRGLDAYTILTTAATAEVKRARIYTDKLLQLSPNAEVYAQHLVQFAAAYLSPRIDCIQLLYRAGEYGSSTASALRKYVGDHGLSLRVKSYERFSEEDSLLQQAERVIESANGDRFQEKRRALIVLAETGQSLRAMAKAARAQTHSVVSTLTSLDDLVLKGGDLDTMLVISSFAPGLFSLNAHEFMQFVERAQVYWNDSCSLAPSDWHRVTAVDAETHDAAVHWFTNSGLSGIRDLSQSRTARLFVTNFFVAGDSSGENTAALYAMRVRHERLIPSMPDA